ncbi:MAG: RluA family pseudouridine synthase [Solirubrobacteraceae bacterium]
MPTTIDNIEVLFEDNHLIVINKQPSDIVQADKTGDVALLEIVKNYIKIKEKKEGNVFVGVTHRIDRPTSGAVIFAKTSKALVRLNEMFRNQEIEKIYWALTSSLPNEKDQDTLTHYLKKNEKNNKSTVFIKETIEAKHAILHYKNLRKLDNYYLLEVKLETGRHHQIRAQLGFLKCPIKGDIKYGAKRTNENGSIHLHSRKIAFNHPIKKEMISIIAPLPKNDKIWEAVNDL